MDSSLYFNLSHIVRQPSKPRKNHEECICEHVHSCFSYLYAIEKRIECYQHRKSSEHCSHHSNKILIHASYQRNELYLFVLSCPRRHIILSPHPHTQSQASSSLQVRRHCVHRQSLVLPWIA